MAGSATIAWFGNVGVVGMTIETSNTAISANATTAPSVTASAGALLVITCAAADDKNTATNVNISSTPSLTWTKQSETPTVSGASGMSEIWTAPFAAGGSITVTCPWLGGTTNASSSVLYSIVGAEAVPGGAATNDVAGSTPSINFTTTRSGSIIFCVSSDWNAVAGTATLRDSATLTLDHNLSPSTYRGYHYYKQAAAIALYVEGLSAPAAQSSGSSLYEIRTP